MQVRTRRGPEFIEHKKTPSPRQNNADGASVRWHWQGVMCLFQMVCYRARSAVNSGKSGGQSDSSEISH